MENKSHKLGIAIANGMINAIESSGDSNIKNVEEIYNLIKQRLSSAEFEVLFRIMCMDIRKYHPILYDVAFSQWRENGQ